MEPKIFVIITAAGQSLRMGFDKLTTPLCGKSVLVRTLEAFQGLSAAETLVTVTPGREEEFKVLLKGRARIVTGGKCRARSVHNAVQAIPYSDDAIVVIHDCDRPFVEMRVILDTIEEAKKTGAAIAAIPCASTVKEANADGSIDRTIPREKLYFASTPQTFQLKILREAYAKIGSDVDWETLTDEAMILEKAAFPVKICLDSEENFKLTTKKDWDFAAFQLSKNA